MDQVLNAGNGILWLDLNFKSGAIEFFHINGYLYDDVLQGELRTGLNIEILEGLGTVIKLSLTEVDELLLWWNG